MFLSFDPGTLARNCATSGTNSDKSSGQTLPIKRLSKSCATKHDPFHCRRAR